MNNEQLENFEELARRAVACKRWKWMPGMRYLVGSTSGRLTDNQCKGKLPLVADAIPDLRDPATLGCLLWLVRHAWSDPLVGIFRSALEPEWCVLMRKSGLHGFHATTEAGALVAALDAAP